MKNAMGWLRTDLCLIATAHTEGEGTSPSLIRLEKTAVTQWLTVDGQVEAVNQGTISAQTQGRIAQMVCGCR